MTEPNLTVRLFTELYNRSEITMKSREKLALPYQYFKAKAQAETKIIEREGFLTFFLDAQPSEIDAMILKCEAPDFLTIHVIFEIITDTLKRAIDAHMENDPKIQSLKAVYFLLKSNLVAETPELLRENPNWLTENAFDDWLNSRANREKIRIWRENGDGCIYCLTEGSVYSNGSMWQCRLCRRSWRKHSYGV